MSSGAEGNTEGKYGGIEEEGDSSGSLFLSDASRDHKSPSAPTPLISSMFPENPKKSKPSNPRTSGAETAPNTQVPQRLSPRSGDSRISPIMSMLDSRASEWIRVKPSAKRKQTSQKAKWEGSAAGQMEKADWYRCEDGSNRTVPEEPGEF